MTSPTERLAARFTPVPVRARADGWTAARQRGFVAALGRGLSVGAAARAVGMSREGAYRLASRPHARSFRRAWRVAQALAQPLPPQRENLWGSHIHDRRPVRRGGRGTRPVSDGRLRVRLRDTLSRRDALRANEARAAVRESYTAGEGLNNRAETFVTFSDDRAPLSDEISRQVAWLTAGLG